MPSTSRAVESASGNGNVTLNDTLSDTLSDTLNGTLTLLTRSGKRLVPTAPNDRVRVMERGVRQNQDVW